MMSQKALEVRTTSKETHAYLGSAEGIANAPSIEGALGAIQFERSGDAAANKEDA